jgi:hypothetical protein
MTIPSLQREDVMKPVIRVIDEILSFTSSDVEWLMRAGPIVERLNEESMGDCPAGTIATRASPEPASGLGLSASVNYRKEASGD